MSKFSNFLIALFYIVSSVAIGDERQDLIDEATSKFADFLLDIEYGLPEYFMVVNVIVESPPDSIVVIKSEGAFRGLQSKELFTREVDWDTAILADEREKNSELPFGFAKTEKWGRLVKGVDTYVFDRPKKTNSEFAIEKYDSRTMREPRTEFIDLYDWPFVVDSCFLRPSPAKGLPSMMFKDAARCFSARRRDAKTLESIWVRQKKTPALSEFIVLERGGLPVQMEVVLFEKSFMARDGLPDPKQGNSRYKNVIQWKEVDDTAVPTLVKSMMKAPNGDIFSLSANIEVYSKDSEQFVKERTSFEQRMERFQSAK